MNQLPLLLLLTTFSAQARNPALLLGPVLTYTEGFDSEQLRRGLSGHVEIGGSLPVGYEDNELFLLARAGAGAPGFSLGAHGGFRSVFTLEEWQTYTDLGVMVHARPHFWIGPRVGVGVRRALTETLSIYGGAGAQLGFGSGLRFDIEVSSGLRWSL
ncbi:hypothetical protein JRI60_29425 [Archangium violaceum]|uniref:hypothetical protein n=1 Tax=Archangium violaceum TaxID=83451 RepID=UPI0019526CDC|nr:hypothetical protein [Archangium violaceum]QRN93311.1 hypothetical protein JRI60_29425 [Archangium violaceum]